MDETISDTVIREVLAAHGALGYDDVDGCECGYEVHTHQGHQAHVAQQISAALAEVERVRREERLEADRHANLLEQQHDGQIAGYVPACGVASRQIPGDDWHLIHKLDDGSFCWGYCNCTYAAEHPHSTGLHK